MGESTLQDFPLFVELNESIPGFNVRQFSSSLGNDLRFFDSTGKEYEYEIESFNLAANKVLAWVKVPALNSDTEFSAYWGNEDLAEYPPSILLMEVFGALTFRSLAPATQFAF